MISLLVSTRNRPGPLRRMIESAVSTVRGEIEFGFWLDADDEVSLPVISDSRHLPGFYEVSDRGTTQAERLNALARMARGDYLMIGADDLVFRTAGWDQLLVEFIPQGGMSGGRDGQWDRTIITHPVVSRNAVQALGWLARPEFTHFYIDTYLTCLFDCCGLLSYRKNVFIEHIHPTAGKAEDDETYQRSQRWFEQDRAAFEECVISHLASDVRTLQASSIYQRR